MKKIFIGVILLLLMVSGCSGEVAVLSIGYEEKRTDTSLGGTYEEYSGEIWQNISLKESDIVTISYILENEEGVIDFQIVDPNSNPLYDAKLDDGGNKEVGEFSFGVAGAGEYKIKVHPQDSKNGTFEVNWNIG